MKSGNLNYSQVPNFFLENVGRFEHEETDRDGNTVKRQLSGNAVKLYCYLKYLENKFCNDERPSFTMDDKRLMDALHMTRRTLARAKAELRNYPDLLTIKKRHILNAGENITAYWITEYMLV